jgi:hypothetical protein
VIAITAPSHKVGHVAPEVTGQARADHKGSSIMNTTVNKGADIRELSLNEIEAVAGGLKFSFAGITIAINEEGVTGIGIGGVIGVGVVDGQVCGYVGPIGGCI